jgi:hypothetical protein
MFLLIFLELAVGRNFTLKFKTGKANFSKLLTQKLRILNSSWHVSFYCIQFAMSQTIHNLEMCKLLQPIEIQKLELTNLNFCIF